MARAGMRIGEVLKLKLNDIQIRKLILLEPKSGKENESVFIPQTVADRLRDYATKKRQSLQDRLSQESILMPSLVASKMGAVILGFRWLLASLSMRRLSPTCHDSVSHHCFLFEHVFHLFLAISTELNPTDPRHAGERHNDPSRS
jgi:integrase